MNTPSCIVDMTCAGSVSDRSMVSEGEASRGSRRNQSAKNPKKKRSFFSSFDAPRRETVRRAFSFSSFNGTYHFLCANARSPVTCATSSVRLNALDPNVSLDTNRQFTVHV